MPIFLLRVLPCRTLGETHVIVAKGLALMFAWLSVLVILGLLISIVRRVVDDKSGNAAQNCPPADLDLTKAVAEETTIRRS